MKNIIIGMSHPKDGWRKELDKVISKLEELGAVGMTIGFEIPSYGHLQAQAGWTYPFADRFYEYAKYKYEIMPIDNDRLHQKQTTEEIYMTISGDTLNYFFLTLERSASMAQKIHSDEIPISIVGNNHLFDMRDVFKLDFEFHPTNGKDETKWDWYHSHIIKHGGRIKGIQNEYCEGIAHYRTPSLVERCTDRFRGIYESLMPNFRSE